MAECSAVGRGLMAALRTASSPCALSVAVLLLQAISWTTAARCKGKYGNVNATSSHEHKLMRMLFRHYDPSVRPRYDSSKTVNVQVRFSLQQINDLDEKRQILKMSGWLTAEWEDEFLVWNPEDYGGLSAIVVEPSRLWIPKLAIGNSANRLFDGEHYKRFWITVRSNGAARWQPGGVFAIACALDMNFYPFDDQKCTMEIETWVYTADKVNLSNSMTRIGLDTYISHGEWTIMKTIVQSANIIYRYYLSESFPEVYFTIYIRRKHTFYFMYILLPCLMLSGVLLMIFLLPADSGEKVSLGVSILVAISVFLLLVAGNVPDTSDAIPIIAIYLTYFMMITTLSVTCSVIVIKLHYKSTESRPPQWLRVFMFNYLSRVVLMNQNNKLSKLTKFRGKRREMTWSETATEELRSPSNSHGTPDGMAHGNVTPDGVENFELIQHRRRPHRGGDAAGCRAAGGSGGPGDTNGSMHLQGHAQELHPLDDTLEGASRYAQVNEWKKMAEVLDRFFFYVFVVCLIVPTATILGFVRLFKPEL